MAELEEKKTFSVELFLRTTFKGLLDSMAAFFNRIGLKPNTMTILGLALSFVGAILLGMGQITLGGIIILIAGPFDAVDGSMARLRGEPKLFGGFADSVSDRYAELAIFGGLMVYYASQGNMIFCLLVYLAASGSVMVSYIRARAEALKFDAKVGMLTRVERYLVLAPCLVFNIPIVAVCIIAFFSHLTAIQRIRHVRRQARQIKEIL